MKLDVWLDLLPAGLGLFVVVVAMGFLGLFRSLALSKQSYTATLDSYQRQLDVLKEENEGLRRALEGIKSNNTHTE